MKIIKSLDQFDSNSCPIILAAGCFDGLHVGHQAVIQVAIDKAKELGGEAWVFTFSPHPAQVLDPTNAPPLIYTTSQQLRTMQEMGVDGCILQPFTRDFLSQRALAFFDDLRTCIPTLAGLSVGEDWSFGKGREGNKDMLIPLCAEHNLFFSAHEQVNWQDTRISSTRIRQAIQLGQFDDIKGMLGRDMSTIGTVVHGEKIGRMLGFPTANIDPENDILPPAGIYAAHLRVGHLIYPAAAYIGHKKTCSENESQVLEVHLIDEKEIDLYDKEVEVSYASYIREDQIFDDMEQLKEQITADIEIIRERLA